MPEDRYATPINSLWKCDDGKTYKIVESCAGTVTIQTLSGCKEVMLRTDWEDYVHGGYYTYMGMN